ncbi:MAG: mechanosensitive ion channel [Moraxella sp.]|nr:mechanosensitive ion channel [Moraxella sp.]
MELLGFKIDIETLLSSLTDFGLQFLSALLIFFIGKWIGGHFINLAKRIMKKSRIDDTVANFVGNVLYGLMLVAVIVAALNKLGINTNSFVAILGAAAVAIGVSLKDQVSNLAAGVMIVIFRPFSRGDTVEIGGRLGTVIDISLVNTRIKTTDNHEVIIPNGDITTNASINYSSLPTRRIPITIGIGYESDIRTARKIMLELATAHELTLKSPAALVRVTELADNAVNMTLYVWSENADWWSVQCDLLESIKYAFDENNISIPYPQRSVHIENLPKDFQLADNTIDTNKQDNQQ